MGFKRRDPHHIFAVFESLCDKELKGLSRTGLLEGLKKFDFIPDILKNDCDHVEESFRKYDVNGDGTIDLDEFTLAVKDSCPNPEWTQTIPLHDLLVDCLPRQAGNNYVLDPNQWTEELLQTTITAFSGGLWIMLKDLKANWRKVDEEELKAEPRLSTGTISNFHEGLTALIGHPHLEFKSAMKSEHCGDHILAEYSFVTSNNGISTYPKKEWEIVMGKREVPEGERQKNREVPQIAELMKREETKKADLIEAEVIGVVLYSGPMYFIYNSILRRREIYSTCVEANHFFSTTIHVLVSAVEKISRVTKLKPGLVLYRGLGHGSGLPDHFFETDAQGCCGFTEWGFMSTTSKKDVAVLYSKADEEGLAAAKLLQLRVWSVDRGACIRAFSQYKDEVEYLYVPCSFLQKCGPMLKERTKAGGWVTVIPVMVDSNLKAQTVEELQNEKRGLHTAAFRHLITEVEVELKELASQHNIQERLDRDKTAAGRTVEGFLGQIMTDCSAVLQKHKVEKLGSFAASEPYRRLVTEMLDVRAMAVSKLREWLENEGSSFLRFRFPCALRTAHRHRLCFLEKHHEALRGGGGGDPRLQKSALEICRLAGFVAKSVHEANELGETPIMVAAAEGRSQRVLQLLVEALADVQAARPDGVTPAHLAAQFGHTSCLEVLHALGADVTARSCNGTSTAHMAAQNGHARCLEVLLRLKADVRAVDHNGQSALDQAVFNNEKECVELLRPLMDKQEDSGSQGAQTPEAEEDVPRKRLIISAGDISDVDGFFSLAQYAKMEADVLFIMNYPAYIDVDPTSSGALEAPQETTEKMREYLAEYGETDLENLGRDELEDRYHAMLYPGQGFRYGAGKILARDARLEESFSSYKRLLDSCRASAGKGPNLENRIMKQALTDLAFAIVHRVWTEQQAMGGTGGQLLFGIGGVNAVNPFSSKAIKNEVLLYSELLDGDSSWSTPDPTSGRVYGGDGQLLDRFHFEGYSEVVLDFCGAYSFWGEGWDQRIRGLHERLCARGLPGVRAAFVMGGVLTERRPVTLPSIAGVLNRLSSATMTQLYHPVATGYYFSFLREFAVPTFVVTNNVVESVSVLPEQLREHERALAGFAGVQRFLQANQLGGPILARLARTYYTSGYLPAQKPFDFYVAFAMAKYLEGSEGEQEVTASEERSLFFGSAYGSTFVSRRVAWTDAKAEFIQVLEQLDEAGTVGQARRKELAAIRDMDCQAPLRVYSLDFQLHPDTKLLSLRPPEAQLLQSMAQDLSSFRLDCRSAAPAWSFR